MTKAITIKKMCLGSGIPAICVPLTGKTQEALYAEVEAVKSAAPDLVEWRADAFAGLCEIGKTLETLETLAGILGEIPLLFTIRTVNEGGAAALSAETYAQINLAVAKNGKADLIDVEIFWEKEKKVSLIEELKEVGAVIIASSHDFQKTDAPEVLKARFMEMNQTGADILKMAVMPKSFQDVLNMLKVTREMVENETEKPVISMSMGKLGALSRICGENSGSALTFGTVGAASAPGQIPIETLRAMMQALH